MSKSFKALVFLGVLCVLFLSGAIAQDIFMAVEKRATGAIPLTAEQLEKVLTTWPRVGRVSFNRIGRERINRVKALKGEPLLPLSAAKAIGHEVESSIHPAGAPATAIALNEDLTGALPVYVDNSTDAVTGLHFPPIRNQGDLGACAAWASTYYQLSYMTALQRGLDIRDPEDNTNKYSPKWSYNLLNGGTDSGSSITNVLTLLGMHGAVTWAEFPYDGTDFLSWCLNTAAWRNALSVRTEPAQYSWHTDTDAGLEVIKQLLANGYVLTYNTYINSWQATTIQDNPSSTDDTSAIGKAVGVYVNGSVGGHSMTIVGYNDSIWTDINGNSTMDAGELGALRIANSWGPGWHPAWAPEDGGFIWLAYDALKAISAVSGGPSTGRQAAFWNNLVYVQTARDNYSPSVIAEFTVNHLRRNQLTLGLGLSATSTTTPTTTWTPIAFYQQGGAYAFDGTTIACDGTFVLDFTDILAWATGGLKRFYLQMNDNTSGDTATLSAFKIVDYTTDPDTTVACALVPQYADASTNNSYVEHTYAGPTRNTLPVITDATVDPVSGTDLDTYVFRAYYIDADGPAATDPPVRNVYIDGTAHQMTYFPNGITRSNAWYTYTTTLPVGNHDYRFDFQDVNGASVQSPITTNPPDYYTYSGPTVALAHIVTTPSTPTGEQNPVMELPYTYSTSGSVDHQGHSIQYQFDWGDGTTSDWLAVGVTSAQHTWSTSGIFSVMAYARCTENNTIVSSWSSSLMVSVAVTQLFSQSFPGSTFPAGWTQQNIGTSNAWSVSSSNHAGGSAYEMRCSWTGGTGTTRLVTPPIDTTGRSTLYLSFKHFYEGFSNPGPQILVQTSPDGTNWTNEAWVVAPTNANIGPETVNTALSHNLDITTTRVAFTVIGSLSSMNYWYIDDVSVSGSAPTPIHKVDFNKDGHEDLLWRYYGEGGFNRIWFMGNAGDAMVPLALSASPTVARGTPRQATTTEITRGFANPQNMGMVRGRQEKRTDKKAAGVMGLQRARARRLATVDDPRKVGLLKSGVEDLAIAARVSDPRQVSQVLGATSDPGASITATTMLGGANLYDVTDLNWQIAGTGDFNNDGDVDILWRYNGPGGRVVVWLMHGTTYYGPVDLYDVTDLNWQVAGTGDFNKDGNVDILWHYNGDFYGTVGYNWIWYMDGTDLIGGEAVLAVNDLNWQIAGTGDFNRDGNVDLLWRYNGPGGYNCVWTMNGPNWAGTTLLYSVEDLNWQIGGVGDFNNDGSLDIIWRYYGNFYGIEGHNWFWYMNGLNYLGGDATTSVPVAWRIVNK